jgi:hypothetical protein
VSHEFGLKLNAQRTGIAMRQSVATVSAEKQGAGFSAKLDITGFDNNPGVFTLMGPLPNGTKTRIDYFINDISSEFANRFSEIESIVHAPSAQQPSAEQKDDGPATSFLKSLRQYLLCEAYLQYAELVRDYGTRLSSATANDEKALLSFARESLRRFYDAISAKVSASAKGLAQIRKLLESSNEIDVSLGIRLSSPAVADALQDELAQVYTRTELSDWVRRESWDHLTPERRRALASAG